MFHICAGEYRGADELTALCQYTTARIVHARKDKLYKLYLTDALYALVNRDMRLATRFCEILDPPPEEDAQAIVDRIRAKVEE